MLRSTSIAVLMTASLGLIATSAQAHPRLQSATPAANSMVTAAPDAIRMNFSEGLVARFTGVDLTLGHGKRVATGRASLDPNDNTKVIVPIKAHLLPGTYNVAWHAVSVDTHRVSGSYTFMVMK